MPSTSASEMRLRTPPMSMSAVSSSGSATTRAGIARHMLVPLRRGLEADPCLTQAEAAVIGRHGHGFPHRDAARRKGRAQATRQDRVQEATATAGDGANALCL